MFFFTLICLCLFALYGVLIDYYRRAWEAISYSSPADGSEAPLLSPEAAPEIAGTPLMVSVAVSSASKGVTEREPAVLGRMKA